MGACELCGAEGVSTRSATVSQSVVDCCSRCIDSMGLVIQRRAPIIQTKSKPETQVIGKGVAGFDIMTKDEMELASDFHSRIRGAREEKGLSQEDLARMMNEKVAVVQKAESGSRPPDPILNKFSKSLGISLLVESVPNSHTVVASEKDRQMTISDAKGSDGEAVQRKKTKKKGRRLGVSRSGARSRR